MKRSLIPKSAPNMTRCAMPLNLVAGHPNLDLAADKALKAQISATSLIMPVAAHKIFSPPSLVAVVDRVVALIFNPKSLFHFAIH